MNINKKIKIEKIVLNIGCGTKRNIEHAKTIIEKISGKKPIITKTKKRSTFNVPKNKPIGCKVTIRKNIDSFLKRLLIAKENTLLESNFDNTGNVSFGIKEYIEIPGMDYDPKIGILGMDVCVTLERPGFRVKKKRITKPVGKKHRISKEEAIEFIKKNFGITIE